MPCAHQASPIPPCSVQPGCTLLWRVVFQHLDPLRALLSSAAPPGSSSSASLHGFNIRALLRVESCTSGSASAGAWLGEVLIPVTVTECVLGQAPWYFWELVRDCIRCQWCPPSGAGLLCTILTQGLYTCLLLPSCLAISSCYSLNWPFSTPCFQYHIENILDSLPSSTPLPVPSQSLSQPTLPMGYQHSTDAKL